jgi:hypothetical protein
MSNTADVIGGKPIAVWLQSISGVNAINPLAFYDIHGRKREMLFFYFVPDTTRDTIAEKLFSICIAPVWNRGESLVSYKIKARQNFLSFVTSIVRQV